MEDCFCKFSALLSWKQKYKNLVRYIRNGKCCGEAFHDIYGGTYYPGISLYKNIIVSVNFGPDFKHPPTSHKFRGMHERCDEFMVEQTLADMTYLVENEGKLRLDLIT